MKRLWISLGLSIAIALGACSSADTDWKKAAAANTLPAYEEFLTRHPNGPHSGEAGDRIHSLQDDEAWAEAKHANSVDAYRDYLQKEPAGSHTAEARDALAASQRAADWATVQHSSPEALKDFLTRYPQGAEADQARQKLAELTGYKVRFGTAKPRNDAERERDRLGARYANILHDVVTVPAAGGNRFNVESAPMGQSEAESACGALKKKEHVGCEVVKTAGST